MKHEMKARFPASSARVIKMFADKDFHTQKLEAMGYAGKYQVLAQSVDKQSFSITIERKVPVSMPGLGKNAPESTVVNVETWDLLAKTGKVEVNVKGMPLEVSCTASMADEGKECVVTYQWNVKSKVPLVGGAIEKMVVGDMQKRATQEFEAAAVLLKNYK